MKLFEKIDKSILSKIPDFDEWREGGGTMEGYYRKKLSREYLDHPIARAATEEDLKWALSQKAEMTPDGQLWEEEQAYRMSQIVRKWPFVFDRDVHYRDDSSMPDVQTRGYENGKYYEDTYGSRH